MRHPHGLRAVAGADTGFDPTTPLGTATEGGYFAGFISHTANGVATHALIVAPSASGATGQGYTNTTNKAWKNAGTTTAGTTNVFDGAVNTAAIVTAGISDHAAAQFCVNLSIGGYSDWYLPAQYELDIAYQLLKPGTATNNGSWGINDYSVPKRTSNRGFGDPPTQTSITAFQSGSSEPFMTYFHWSSTQSAATTAWCLNFYNGFISPVSKTSASFYVRAFRKVAL